MVLDSIGAKLGFYNYIEYLKQCTILTTAELKPSFYERNKDLFYICNFKSEKQ